MAGAIIGGKTDENGFSWENSSNGFMIGSIAGAGAVIGVLGVVRTMLYKTQEKWLLKQVLII